MPGLDNNLIIKLNPTKALARIGRDVLSDFIVAPHYAAVFRYASDKLWTELKSGLANGTYNPMLPITIEVPKKSGLTRPGSILKPIDRVLYQCLIDTIAPNAENDIDRKRVFSNILSNNEEENSGKMFENSGESYQKLKAKLGEMCLDPKYYCVLVTDVASYFERIYQHVLVNLLRSTANEPGYINLLEKVLLGFTQKDSHGIIQGVFPSDFLGNYYLVAFDRYLTSNEIEYIRYVDDYWMFFSSLGETRRRLVDICSYVRKEGLYLNEYKTRIRKTNDVHIEETELDRMFEEAKEEFTSFEFLGLESNYSFEPLDVQFVEDEDCEIKAIQKLYGKRAENSKIIEKIDKFCLPYLARYNSDIAVTDAISGIEVRPHIANIYVVYLTALVRTKPHITIEVERVFLNDKLNYDWQKMWVAGFLFRCQSVSKDVLNKAYSYLVNNNISEAVRALCALIISKHGDGANRRLIRNRYVGEPSDYVKEAILYSTKFFPSNDDRNACINVWETHSQTNKLISEAMKAEAKDTSGDN